MPKQNRVTPFGEIVAVSERGTMMGNRGVLHDERQRTVRPWQVKRWLLCRLEFRRRHRTVMTPGRYTELFFLDEATGLAAGHRPCFECRREAFYAFAEAWEAGNSDRKRLPTAGTIDERLHSERIGPGRSKRTFRARAAELPDGTFIALDDNLPRLIWRHRLLSWTPGGYTASEALPRRREVTVLTPRSTVSAIRAAYMLMIHPTADHY